MMLSRVAENLFWIGRNVERSINICRLLDATYQVQLGQVRHPLREDGDSGMLLPVRLILGLETSQQPIGGRLLSELARMTFSREEEHSVATLLAQAKENTRASQDVLGAAPFPQINRLSNLLNTKKMRVRFKESPSRALNRVAQSCLLFFALIDDCQMRDAPWHFINLGRRIESIGILSRILYEGLAQPLGRGESPGFVHWTWLLNSCAARDAFMKRHPGGVSAEGLVDQLMLESQFPHSIRFGVSQARESLESIQAEVNLEKSGDAERLIGRLDSLLQYMVAGEVLADGLEGVLGEIQWTCDRVSERLYATYF